jgi:hypothetical protein
LTSNDLNKNLPLSKKIKYHKNKGPILHFKNKKQLRKVAILLQALAIAGRQEIHINENLKKYVYKELNLFTPVLSFFNHEGKMAFGDTLATLKQKSGVTTSMTTREKHSYSLLKDPLLTPAEIEPCSDCGGGGGVNNPTVEYSRSRYLYSPTEQKSYYTRAVALNESYSTWLGFSRSRARTYLQISVNGVWTDLEQSGFFPQMQVKATVTSDELILFNCDTRSSTDTDTDGAVYVGQGRCDGTGTTSTNLAEAGPSGGPFIWPGGAIEIELP